MSQRYLPCEREQQDLMPASLRDWLPEDHLACFVVEAVELLDGAKLRANASRERNRTLAQLEAEVERMLSEAEQADTAEPRRGMRRDDPLSTALRGAASGR